MSSPEEEGEDRQQRRDQATNYVVEASSVRVLRLSPKQKIALFVFGKTKLDRIKLSPSWKNKQQFYAFKCRTHGIVASYPGTFERLLVCPDCLRAEES